MSEWIGAPWATVGWVAASTVAIYVTAVVCVRIAGRRTLAEFSAFDTVVTIALGSIVATTAVQRSASYVQGATAIVTLLVLQTVVAAARQRFASVRRALDFGPRIVVRDGSVDLPTGPLGSQLTDEELRSRLRQQGVFSLEGLRIAIVEPTGEISISHAAVPTAAIDRIERRD